MIRADRRGLALALLLVGCAQARPPRPSVAPTAPRVELWLDASALPGGDGSRTRPQKTWPRPVPAGALVHLASGLYPGPGPLPAGVELRGAGAVVLFAQGPGVVLEVGDARLVNLSVQGAQTGLLVRGEAVLERVNFSGHSVAAVEVAPGGSVRCAGCTFDGTIPGTDGVRASGATVVLTDVRFTGALRHGVKVTGGEVRLERAHSLGPRSVLTVLDARAVVLELDAAGGRGAAVFVSGGALEARGLVVDGHEYALQVNAARVDVEGLTSRGAGCGLALRDTTGRVARVAVERAGPFGAVQVFGGEVTVEGLTVRAAQAVGVLVRQGSARLSGVRIEGVSREGGTAAEPSLGDGLHLRDATVRLEDVEVRDAEGSALYAAAEATVELASLLAERSGTAAVTVERAASLQALRVTVVGAHGPAVLLLDRGHARLGRLEVRGAEDAVWADCERGAWAEVEVLVWDREVLASRCVRVGPAAPAR